MRGRWRTGLGITVMLTVLGTGTVRAEEAGAVTVRAEEIAAPTPWAAPPLHAGLFATYATLQALDFVTTVNAVHSGRGQEINPLVGDLAKHPAAFAATKGVSTLLTLVFMHRYAKEHPKAAAITMMVFNAAYTYVVASNARIAYAR